MIFFSPSEIIYSIAYSFVLGIIFGCIYSASEVIFSSLNKLVRSVPTVYKNITTFSKKTVRDMLSVKYDSSISNFYKNIKDAVLFLFFGISTIILIYITLDGVFRLYVLLTLTASFILAKKTLGTIFCTLFEAVFRRFYIFVVYLEYFTLYPIRIFINYFKKILYRSLRPINAKIKKVRINKLIKRKINEVAKCYGK